MAFDRTSRDDAALDWALRAHDPDFADWEALTDWLEADPANPARYHAIAADIADAADVAERLPATPVDVPTSVPGRRDPRLRRWMTGAVAASTAAVIGYGVLELRPQPYAIETAAGTMRTVRLADGSVVSLNGGTRLVLDRRDERHAALERGQALFTIRHDAAHPFKVTVGSDELIDIGTIFDVTRTADETRVAVSQGAVIFNPDGQAVTLTPGRSLRVRDRGTGVTLGTVETETVGTWRRGYLAYDGTPLSDVAVDLSRALGVSIAAAPEVAGQPFRGTIALEGMADDPAALGPLLGASLRRDGDGWEIVRSP